MLLKELINKYKWNGYVFFVWFLVLYGDDRCLLLDIERGFFEKYIEWDLLFVFFVFFIRFIFFVNFLDDFVFCLKMGVKFGMGVIGL